MRTALFRPIILSAMDIVNGSSVAEKLRFLEKSQYWTEKELIEYQNKKLQKLILHAYENVPYYKELFDENNIDHYPFQDPNGWLLELEGDANCDGIVDIFDGVIIAVAFGSRPENPKWNQMADIIPDNFIDIQDIVLWATHFGETYP